MGVDVETFENESGGRGSGKTGKEGFGGVNITAKVDCDGKTGVEMEALTAATVAGLAMYDMLKGVDKGMWLGDGRVVRKEGGKSGGWVWDEKEGKVVKIDADSEEGSKR